MRYIHAPQTAMTDTVTPKPPCAAAARLPWGALQITERLSVPELGQAQFAATVFSHGLRHTVAAQWTSTSESLEAVLPHAQSTVRAHRMQSALLDLAPVYGELAFALITLRRGTAHVDIAAENPQRTGEIERWLRATFPAPEATERREIAVRFWSCSPHGAGSSSRTISVPPLGEIEANYPTGVRDRLARLAGPEFRPGEGGQLILWYGPPGTGKTYALRALGWEWREWCELHYVIDPEVFFGQRADYMIDVLLDEDEPFPNHGAAAEVRPKWRLLVLEDTGELLAADAKHTTGQGLSRLLNLVDGMVGQGLRVLVLVTTNEPLRRLHPAVARPGRCAAQIEFEPFDEAEATAWLAARGLRGESGGALTLAHLFARLHGYESESEPEHAIGFGA
jgi:hypothetical protein